MKSRDGLMLSLIVGGLVLAFLATRYLRPERVRPGSPEYAEYIEYYVGRCLLAPARYDVAPMEPGPELEAACRTAVLQADRFNPGARPLKR